jgi:hypothetical protein
MEVEFDHKNLLVSKEWLTAVLREGGFLTSGEVIDIEQKPSRIGETITSVFFELSIKYSPYSEGSHPSNCLLKAGKPELFEFTRKEAAFYEMVASGTNVGSLLKFYGSSISQEDQSAVVLLEDKGEADYMTTEWPIPPKIEVCELAVRSLAQVHARWWESPILGSEGFERVSAEKIDGIFQQFEPALALFFESIGDGLSQSRLRTLEMIAERLPVILKQYIDGVSAQTLVHGDAHFWNFLFPKDESEPPILIDWQGWEIGTGVSDLAYMIGLHWFPERRARFEKRILGCYLDELHLHNIDYSHDDLWRDYRLRIALQPIIPVFQAQLGIPAGIWWPHLDRAFSAFDDLSCEEFLG